MDGAHQNHTSHSPCPPTAGIKACVDVGRLREADRLLGRMAGAGAPPDARAYNILLAGHARAANAGAMARLLQRMTAAGVAASAVTYNTLIDGHVRAGDLAGAKAAAVQAAAVGIALDVWAYSTLIKGHVQVGDGMCCACWMEWNGDWQGPAWREGGRGLHASGW